MTASAKLRPNPRPARAWALAIILAGYALLAVAYSVSTPPFETYDERYHFAYILSVALDHGLPVQNVADPGPWGNEGSQPPLYYVLAAAATFWTATPGLQSQIIPNPYATRHQNVEADDNRNYFIHYQTEAFPYQGNILALHLARGLAVCFGALGIAATYWTARRLWPDRPAVAAGAAGFEAFIPSYLHVTASASNDAAVIGLASLALCMIVYVLYSPAVSGRRALALGALAGLAVLAKLSALPLLPVALLALYWTAGGRANWRRAVQRCVACAAGFLAVSGWWFARNWILYGELLGTDTMNRIAGLRTQPPTASGLWDEIRLEIERNFWAAFGSGNIHPPDFWLLLPRAIAVAGLLGCGLLVVRARRAGRGPVGVAERRVLIACILWVSALVLSLGWWLLHVDRVTGRLLFPALTPLCLAVAIGWTQLPAVGRRAHTAALIGLPMAVLAASLLFVSLRPAYAPPPVVTMADAAAEAQVASDLVFGSNIRLWGFTVRETTLAPGGLIHVDYYWQALSPLTVDYTVFTHILGPGQQAIGGTDSVPGRGALPTRDWVPGQIYKDTMSVYLDTPPLEPVAGTLVTGWYDMHTKQLLAPRAADGSRPRPALGQIRILPAFQPLYQPSHAVSANFGGQVELIGYDLGAEGLVLYWKSHAPLADGYTVFVHALDTQGHLLSQADGAPRGGDYPSSLWEPGEIVRDPRALHLPAAAAAIEVGWYRLDSGERLPLVGQAGDAFAIKAGQ